MSGTLGDGGLTRDDVARDELTRDDPSYDELSYDELAYDELAVAGPADGVAGPGDGLAGSAGQLLTGLVVLLIAVLGAPQVWGALQDGGGPALVFFPVLVAALGHLALTRSRR